MYLRPVVVVIVSALTDACVNATGEQVGAETLSKHPLTAGSSARNESSGVRIVVGGFWDEPAGSIKIFARTRKPASRDNPA